MPKRISKPKRPVDVNQWAHQMVQESTKEQETTRPITKSDISRIMAEMGRKGGKKGGKRRLETMTPAQRSDVALKAAQTRWANEKAKHKI